MTRISAIGIALLCILCVTSCGLKSRQTTTESSSETGYSPVTTDTAATIVPCYAKGYTVKYLPHHVRRNRRIARFGRRFGSSLS